MRMLRDAVQILFVTIGLTGLGPLLLAEDWVVGDAVYRKVRIHQQTPATVTVFHAEGITQMSIAELPVELRERLHYDEKAAAEWLARESDEAERERVSREAEPVPESTALDRQPDALGTTSSSGVVFHEEVDLRPGYRELGLYSKNQGRRPSCSIFAVVSALEYARGRQAGERQPLSEEFLIWATRDLYPGIDIDSGFNFEEVMSALQVYGVPPLELMPNTIGKKTEAIEPTPQAIEAAKGMERVVPVWFRVRDEGIITRIVAALNEGHPVVVGVRWPHWRALRDTNLLSEQTPLPNAAHAVTLVGYRNTGGRAEGTTFIFRNSYGYDWGLAGHGFMRADYLSRHLVSALYLRAGM